MEVLQKNFFSDLRFEGTFILVGEKRGGLFRI